MKPKKIGERIKFLREHYKPKGLTGKKLAEIAKISTMQLINIEADRVKSINYDVLKRISNGLGTTLEWLESGTGEMLPNGDVDISNIINSEEISNNPYENYAIKRLEEEANKWQEEAGSWKNKCDEAFAMLNKMIDRFSMGKHNPFALPAGSQKSVVKGRS